MRNFNRSWNHPVFFARKFEAVVNHQIYNDLESFFLNRNLSNVPNINKYWQNDYHFEDSEVKGDRLTFYYIFALLTLQKVSVLCNTDFYNLDTFDYQDPFSQLNIIESTAFFDSDSYRGSLIHFSYQPKESKKVYFFETRINPIPNFKFYDLIGPTARLKHIQVISLFCSSPPSNP